MILEPVSPVARARVGSRDVGVLRHGVGQGRSVGATDDDRRQQLPGRFFNEQYNTGGSIRIDRFRP